jgi:hypothetical protein
LDLTHCDIWGPQKIETHSGAHYFFNYYGWLLSFYLDFPYEIQIWNTRVVKIIHHFCSHSI